MVSGVDGSNGGTGSIDFAEPSADTFQSGVGDRPASSSTQSAGSAVDLGNITRHPYGANIPDYRAVDNFTADYVGNKDLASAMKDLSGAYHTNGVSMTPDLEGKINAVSDAMGISREEGMRNHARLADAFIESRQAPPMAPELALKNQEKYQERMPPAPQLQEGFWASGTQLGAGYLAGKSIGTNPVWGALFSTSMGLTGPGSNLSVHLSEDTFAKMPGDGFWAGAYNALASVGNFFADAVGDHSKIHDVLGHLYTKLDIGPGYTYAPGAIPPAGNFTTGQVSGTLYSLGRKTVDLASDVAQDAWSGVGNAASNVVDFAKDVASGIVDTGRNAWDGVKETFGFGDGGDADDSATATASRPEKQERGDEPSVRSERNDPQMDSRDVRDSGSF